MLQYIIILLDDTSVSYCHYENPMREHKLIDLDVLKRGIVFAMKENLNIQFVYPDYELPQEYNEAIESIDHTKIKPQEKSEEADVVVLTKWKKDEVEVAKGVAYIVRADRKELKEGMPIVKALLGKVSRLNIVETDVMDFRDEEIDEYKNFMEELNVCLAENYQQGKSVQLNLLTDRMLLSQMNNCGAGDTTITLAPNGKFYLCPAFYYDTPSDDMGDLEVGLKIKNQQLLRLDHAPICRHCDAYQCKRCVWMNQKLTLDLNTPSHQQCVVAHVERNASRHLQKLLNEKDIRLSNNQEIKEINSLDPFNNYKQWK